MPAVRCKKYNPLSDVKMTRVLFSAPRSDTFWRMAPIDASISAKESPKEPL
jgi:hypothetical protein